MILINHNESTGREAKVWLRELSEHDDDVFKTYPQLLSIWSGELLGMARDGFVELERCSGGRFLIECETGVIGITGYFSVAQDPLNIRLRWHGLIPEVRGRGLSEASMRHVALLGATRFPRARRLIETMPSGETGEVISKYFQSMGFSKFGAPEPVGISGFGWQSWAIELELFLNPKPVLKVRSGPKI